MTYPTPTPAELADLRRAAEDMRFKSTTGELRPIYESWQRSAELTLTLLDAYERNAGAEDDATISKWAVDTFGEAGSNIAVAARANKEMAELLFLLAKSDTDPKAAEEAADVVIVLARIFTRMGTRMRASVDAKMKINRQREWVLDGHGHGQHKVTADERGVQVTHPDAAPYTAALEGWDTHGDRSGG